MNVATNLETSTFYFSDRSAIREGAREVTYAQLNEQANRVATALIALGIKPGDLVKIPAAAR